MHIENLVKMANQIGSFFEAMPDRAVALEEMAQHIRKFWEPRMRKQLLEHASEGGDGFSTMAQEVILRHGGMLQ